MLRYVGWFLVLTALSACGKNNFSGIPTAAGFLSQTTKEYPGVVMVVLPSGNGFCTGVIVGEKAVLTAAHCLDAAGRYTVTAPVGTVSTTQRMTLGSGSVEDDRDLGFLIFDSKLVTDNSQIYRIGDSAHTGDAVTLVGFGCTSTTTKVGGGTKRVGTNVIAETGDFLVLMTPKNFNAGIIGDANQAGTCFGDSGGPLFRKSADGSLNVVGITHAGGSDSKYYYSEFVDVANRSDTRDFLRSVETQTGIDIQGL